MLSFEDVKHRAVNKAANLLNRTRSSPKAAATALVTGYTPSHQLRSLLELHDPSPPPQSASSSSSSSSSAVSLKVSPRGPRPLPLARNGGGAVPSSLSSSSTQTRSDALSGVEGGHVETNDLSDGTSTSPTDDRATTLDDTQKKTAGPHPHSTLAPAPIMKPTIGEHHTLPVLVDAAPKSPPRPPTHRVGPPGAPSHPDHSGSFGGGIITATTTTPQAMMTTTMTTTTTSTNPLPSHSHTRRHQRPTAPPSTIPNTPHNWIIPPLASTTRTQPPRTTNPGTTKRTNPTKREGGVAGGVVRGRGEGGGCRGQGTPVSPRSIWDAPGSPVQYSPTEEPQDNNKKNNNTTTPVPERRPYQQHRRPSQPQSEPPVRPLQPFYQQQQRRQDPRARRSARPGSSGTALPQLAITNPCSTPRRRRVSSHTSHPTFATSKGSSPTSASISLVAEPGLVPRPLQLSPKHQQQQQSQPQPTQEGPVVVNRHSQPEAAQVDQMTTTTTTTTHEHVRGSRDDDKETQRQQMEWTSIGMALRGDIPNGIPVRPRNPVPRALTYGAEHTAPPSRPARPTRPLALTYREERSPGEEEEQGESCAPRQLALTNGETSTSRPTKALTLITTTTAATITTTKGHLGDAPPDYSPTDPEKNPQQQQAPSSPSLARKPVPPTHQSPQHSPSSQSHNHHHQQESHPPPYSPSRIPARKPLPATVSTPEMEEAEEKCDDAAGRWEAVAIRSIRSVEVEKRRDMKMKKKKKNNDEGGMLPLCLIRKPVPGAASADGGNVPRVRFL